MTQEEIVRMNRQGMVIIPKRVREEAQIPPGETNWLSLKIDDRGCITLRPVDIVVRSRGQTEGP